MNQCSMPRFFVIIGESSAVMTNCDDRLFEVDKMNRSGFRYLTFPLTLAKHRIQRVLCEHMLDVGDQQFLVLLLMMKTENQDRLDLIEQFFVRTRKQIVDMRIDRCAVALRFADCRARNQAAQIAPVHVSGSVVVRIKKIGVLGNFSAITRTKLFQDKGLEKPRRVSKVPLRRTDVRHRLHNAIFRLETCTERVGEVPNLMKTTKQALNALGV